MVHIPIFISGAEIAFIVFILVMVFGADRIPEIARGLGKGMRTIKNATNDIKSEITRSADLKDLDVTDIVKPEIEDIKKTIKDVSGSIKRK